MTNLVLMTTAEAARLKSETRNAYSFDAYRNWDACVDLLRRRGFNAREAEAILRSKHMRWAGDASSNPYGYRTSKDLAAYLDRNAKHLSGKALADLVAGTF